MRNSLFQVYVVKNYCERNEESSVIVFCESCRESQALAIMFNNLGFKVRRVVFSSLNALFFSLFNMHSPLFRPLCHSPSSPLYAPCVDVMCVVGWVSARNDLAEGPQFLSASVPIAYTPSSRVHRCRIQRIGHPTCQSFTSSIYSLQNSNLNTCPAQCIRECQSFVPVTSSYLCD